MLKPVHIDRNDSYCWRVDILRYLADDLYGRRNESADAVPVSLCVVICDCRKLYRKQTPEASYEPLRILRHPSQVLERETVANKYWQIASALYLL